MTSALPLLLLLLAPTAPTGAPIAAVRIETATERDSDRLRRYVTVRAGAPLDPDEVRRSVQYLFATGEFADVVVERRGTAAGIEVVFRLVPAPCLSAVAVEGDRVLTASRLRHVTRLRDGEILWPRRLDRAAQDAALDLADAGFLEARVSAHADTASPSGRVVFHVQSGPMTRIGSVNITGLDTSLEQNAARRLQSRPEFAFSRKRAQADGNRLRQWLRQGGYWSASVDVRETYDPSQNRIALTFGAQTGPSTTLVFRGLAPGRRLQSKARQLLVESGLRSDALEEVSELLEEDLRKQGFAFAKVAHEQEEGPEGRRVVFDRERGPLVRVAAIRIEGAPSEEFAHLVTTRAGQPYRQQQVEHDVQALKRALAERGFADAQVEADAPAHAASTPLVVRIRPGRRLTLASVNVLSPVALPGATPQDLGMSAGDPYRAGEVARARAALTATYHNAGYTQAAISVETTPAADRSSVALTFRVDPGSSLEIEHVLVAGLQYTHEEVVRRELLIHGGEPLRWDRVLESHRRLSALALFRGVSVYELDPDESERRTLVFGVEEGARTRLNFGLGAAGISTQQNAAPRIGDVNPTLRLTGEVTRRNLGGLDRDVSLFARIGFSGLRFLAAYREPYLLGHKDQMSVSAFYEEEQRPTFNFDRRGVSLQMTHALAARWRLILRYVLSRTSSNVDASVPLDQVDRQYRNERSSGPSFSLLNDTRDDPLDPRRGHFLSIDSQLSHAAFGGRSFSKSFVQASAFQPLRGRFLLAVGARLGATWTFRGQALDAPDRFYAGGDYSMRGFDTDAVAPNGGLALALGSIELRCALGRGLSLAAFSDTGGVGGVYPTEAETQADCSKSSNDCYPNAPRFSRHDTRASAGVGLRYRTPVGPIRVDWAFKLDPRPGEPRNRLHVTVGHAF
jgi:outer membrane protein insertion porin family